ncbi:MAG: VCBS repeat-containing protein, partial [Halobacteriovoraceae bacterium]|nr:VCBS repeat-containing protein [Halobacteriovoraceae bacterium]
MMKFFFLFTFLTLNTALSYDIVELKNIKSPQMTKVADFNNDGLPDIVTSSLSSELYHIYIQKNARQFEKVMTINLTDYDVDVFSMSFELGHFDNDTNIDLMIINDVQKIYYFRGDGQGAFSKKPIILPLGPPVDQLAIKVNTNNDKKDDLIISTNYILDGNLGLDTLVGKHSKTLQYFKSIRQNINIKKELEQRNIYEQELEIDFLAVGEFTGDKIKDLVIVSTGHDFFMILKGLGGGRYKFFQLEKTLAGPTGPYALDVDDDGIDELVFSHMKDKRSLIYHFKGMKLELQQQVVTGSYVSGFSLDTSKAIKRLVALSYFDGSIKFFNNWNKTYFETSPSETLQVAIRAMWLNHADFDLDGAKDYLVTDFYGLKLIFLY